MSRTDPQVTSRRRLIGAALGTVLAGRSTLPSPAAQSAKTGEPGRRPNIVLIVLDDLDSTVVTQMPEFQKLVVDQGVTFANCFVTTPVCGPARASLLRGQYAHNHGMLANTGAEGGFATFHRLGREESTVATWLQEAGYRTALAGKYLNGFPKGVGPRYIPPGWDEWFGLASKQPSYLDYQLNENGQLVAYGKDPKDYSTDVLVERTIDFVRRTASAGQPFFVYLAPLAPHWPAIPAPRHAQAFAQAQAPRRPSFNEADIDDKPTWLRNAPLLNDDQIMEIDDTYRQRLRSLLAVDELIATLLDTLQASGTLENTYILVTSDNGSFTGEHRLNAGKQAPYEEAIRVPLVVRGPDVLAGQVVQELSLNIDLAPMIAELAGVTPPAFVDGRSLVPQLHGERTTVARQAFLIELFAPIKRGGAESDAEEADNEDRPAAAVTPYLGLRTANLLYVEYDDGEREFYDMRGDPYQLDNLAEEADPALMERLSTRLAELVGCAGDTCQTAESAPLESFGIP